MNELQCTNVMLYRALVLHAHDIAVPIVLDIGCPAKFLAVTKSTQSRECLLLVQSAKQATSQSISDSVRESESL